MKVIVSGSRSINILPSEAINSLDKIMQLNFQIFIGDAPGVDKLVQEYLVANKYNNVVVCYCQKGCRNNIGGFPTMMVGKNYSERDAYMCSMSQFGLAIWDGKSKGTQFNIERVSKTKIIKV